MEYILTERQFELISKRLVTEQKGTKTKAIDFLIDKVFGSNLNDAEKLLAKQEAELVVPSSLKRSLDDLDQALSSGTKTAAQFEDELAVLMKTPALADFIIGAIERKSPAAFEKLSVGTVEGFISDAGIKNGSLEKIISLSQDLQTAQSNVKRFMRGLGFEGAMNEKMIDNYVTKKFKNNNLSEPTTKSKFDLTKTTHKVRPVRDFGKIKISDNLVMTTKPRWKDYVAEIQNIKNPDQSMSLKKGTNESGEFYYISAKMENPIDAGRSLKELMKKIPKGSRFGEPASGSLSTDSFYNMLRRVKAFEPKIIGRIRLNKSGVKRFQEFIKNPVESNEYPPILRFRNFNDAKPLVDALNNEIKNVGLNTSATISKNSDGLFEILIPNIELIVK